MGRSFRIRLFWVFVLAGCLLLVSSCELMGLGGGEKLVTPVEGYKGESLYPRSAAPEETVLYFDAYGMDARTKTLVNTAQGIINRDKTQLWLYLEKPGGTAAEKEFLSVKHDEKWLKWLVDGGYIQRTARIGSLEELLDRFEMRDVVIVDEKLPVGLNIACMAAAVHGAAVAYPEHVEKYDLNVVEDLRGRFSSNVEAYRWAWETLWPEMDHSVIACLGPIPELSHLRDYLVGKKVFTLWPSGEIDGDHAMADPAAELAFTKEMLGQMPVNIAVMGYPWAGKGVGIGEQAGVRLFSEYGKFLVPVDWKTNLTVWTGLQAKGAGFYNLPGRKVELESDKVYAAFVISDGDNLNTWYDYFPMYWQSPYRGQIPVGWAMGPSLLDLQAPLLDYYYPTLEPTDSIGCAVSGVGYIYPGFFAMGFEQGKRKAVWDGFIELTREYMGKLDMDWIWIINYTGVKDSYLQPYVQDMGDMLTGVYPGYGSRTPWDRATYTLGEVPVFRSINRGYDPAKGLEEIVGNLPDQRPAFVHIFLQNWGYHYEDIKELVDQLPEDFVIVRPDELGALYKEHQALKEAMGP